MAASGSAEAKAIRAKQTGKPINIAATIFPPKRKKVTLKIQGFFSFQSKKSELDFFLLTLYTRKRT